MNTLKLAAATLAVACIVVPVTANAGPTWDGTANYQGAIGQGGTVGPFNTYDFSSAGVLLLDPQSTSTANGYYQSFVDRHLLDGILVNNPGLNSTYEITVVADFVSNVTSNSGGVQTFSVASGNFSLWLDAPPNHNFNTDSGFMDGTKIMSGTVLSGVGSNITVGASQTVGFGSLQLKVTSYDQTIYSPSGSGGIGGGESIFTLRLNNILDSAFITPITSVQSVAYNAASGDLKYAADGNLILTPVPEPESYAMLLAGLGLLGTIARRRSKASA